MLLRCWNSSDTVCLTLCCLLCWCSLCPPCLLFCVHTVHSWVCMPAVAVGGQCLDVLARLQGSWGPRGQGM